jgi:hypothetical protein
MSNIINCNSYDREINKLGKENYDTIGIFYSLIQQMIEPSNEIILEKQSNVQNINFINGSSNINIIKTGIYIINITCYFDQPGQLVVIINNNPELSTLSNTNIIQNPYIAYETHLITIHKILYLKLGDIISIRNYNTSQSIVTNICLKLWKIS